MFKLILVRFDRDAGRFEDEEFNKFCAEQNIVRIEKEFINTGGEIYYSFFIEYHSRKAGNEKPDMAKLSERELEQYNRLRDWRNELAANDGSSPPMPENFVLVEGGTFNNGTSDVTVSSFYIDKYELTQAGYQAVMGSNPASGYGVGDTYPVYYVSWFNAIEYCNRRSMQEGLTPCYSYLTYGTNPDNWPAGWNTNDNNHTNVSCNWSANGYRLPTEMEWMFAAKGGNQSLGYTYSGSNTIGNVAWYTANSNSHTWDIGLKASNELGIFDMSGNLWEWVWDIDGYYPSGPQTNPTGPTSGGSRVKRGGGWISAENYCSVTRRLSLDAVYMDNCIGFRCSRIAQ